MLERIRRKFRGLSKKRRRILTLDLLRGFFLFAIILNHSPLSPRLTDLIVGGGDLLVSAAEGFFIISGLLVGYLYAHRILISTRGTVKKIWKRALLLYILSIATTLAYTLIGNLISDPTQPSHLYTGSIFNVSFWQSVFSLTYVYGWADFLSRYAVFMLLAPIGLLLIATKKAHILAIVSILLWWVSPVIGLQQFTAWQILFVFGMIAGSYLEEILDIFKNRRNHTLIHTSVVIFLVTASISSYVTLIYPFLRDAHLLPGVIQVISDQLSDSYNAVRVYFDKETMGIGRLVLVWVWFIALFSIFWKYERQIERYSYGLLTFLGKNTLTIYVIHSAVIFFLCLIFTLNTSQGMINNTLVALIALVSTFGLTRLYFYCRTVIEHRKFIVDNRHQSE